MYAIVSDENEVVAVTATKEVASTILMDDQFVVRANTVCPPQMLAQILEGSDGLCDWIYWRQ